MSTNLYSVTPGQAATAQDLNQLVAALSGANDIALLACFQPLAAPGAPTATVLSQSGNLSGAYQYAVTFLTGWETATKKPLYSGNQTAQGTPSNIVNPSGNPVQLANIPVGPTGVIARNLWRTKAGGSVFYFLATIADNVTTSWEDNVPDSQLGTQTAPTVNTTGTPVQLPVYPEVPGFVAPAGALVVAGSGNSYTLYQSTGSTWQPIGGLSSPNTWTAEQTFQGGVVIDAVNGTATAGHYGVATTVAAGNGVAVGTTSTTLATFTPPANGLYRVSIYLDVATATTVSLSVSYTDPAGSQTNTILNNTSLAVGPYAEEDVYAATTSGAITVTASAGSANAVTATVTIEGVA